MPRYFSPRKSSSILNFFYSSHFLVDIMATKTQVVAIFLFLNVIFGTFALAQLCPLTIVQATLCGGLLDIINVGGVTGLLQGLCCNLFTLLASDQTTNCLYTSLKVAVLGLNISLLEAINLVLKACGKSYTIGSCP